VQPEVFVAAAAKQLRVFTGSTHHTEPFEVLYPKINKLELLQAVQFVLVGSHEMQLAELQPVGVEPWETIEVMRTEAMMRMAKDFISE